MPIKKLHLDIETYSSVDIKSCGAYKYVESIDFEILLVAYAFDDNPVRIIDLAQGETLPKEFIDALHDPEVENHAQNAVFERIAFRAYGYDIPIEQWHCSSVKAGFCGLPLSLEMITKAMKLEEKGKLATGKALIRYFCCPIKPTKVNGMRTRNFPQHNPEKWQEFREYCIQDVEAEREIDRRLINYSIPQFERNLYFLDQKINDKGILIDIPMADMAIAIDGKHALNLSEKICSLTGISNSNSTAQLKKWLGEAMQKEITSLAKDDIPTLIEEVGAGTVKDVLELRQKASKTSIKKYLAMTNCVAYDGRAHGLFQFYGANRTGRWAGRLIQLQNLPRNYMKDIEHARQLIRNGDYDLACMMYDDVADILSQLIRTAFIAKQNHTFAVSDFSAIEARVISWLANEKWRLEVFRTHGKIYEASAAMMYGLKVEDIKKGSKERDKGKIAELALGYQGAVGALKKMGGEAMGLSDFEMDTIVKKWRKANPKIVALWKNLEECAIRAVRRKSAVTSESGHFEFNCDGKVMTIRLPSGRKLYYQEPTLYLNKWDKDSLKYKGMNQTTKQWEWVETYGGKIAENVVQAVARDLLADAMVRIDAKGFDIVMHVHDEVVCEVLKDFATESLCVVSEVMGAEVDWAVGLPLGADGYITEFYKKD